MKYIYNCFIIYCRHYNIDDYKLKEKTGVLFRKKLINTDTVLKDIF